MSNCCEQTLSMIRKMYNSQGGSETYQYPKEIELPPGPGGEKRDPIKVNHIGDIASMVGGIEKIISTFGINELIEEPIKEDSQGRKIKVPDPEIKVEELKQIEKKGLPLPTVDKQFKSYYDIIMYLIESSTDFVNLFPRIELADSEIESSLLFPRHKGKRKINNLIQFYEVLLLYLNNTLGNPQLPTVIEAEKEEDQITVENFNISEILRKIHRISMDTNSDLEENTDISLRTLLTVIINQKMGAITSAAVEAIAEDMGFLTDEENPTEEIPLAADPYLGLLKDGRLDPEDEKLLATDQATIKENLAKFLQKTKLEIPVIKKSPTEITDLRDLLAQIGRYAAEAAATGKIPASKEAIKSAIDQSRFTSQVQSALNRIDIQQAMTLDRNRRAKKKENK